MHAGTALCSTRSELKMRRLFILLFSKSYSTCFSVTRKNKEAPQWRDYEETGDWYRKQAGMT